MTEVVSWALAKCLEAKHAKEQEVKEKCDCVVFNNNLGGKWYFVECIECKAQGPRMTTHKHACEAWNRRANGK